jgi:hypothetical protein
MLGAIGPRNDTSIDVETSMHYGRSVTGPADMRSAGPVTPVVTARLYPALNDLIQPHSLYEDVCGYEPIAGTESGGFITVPGFYESLTQTERSELGLPQETPTPAAWLYPQYTPTGWSESTGAGNAGPSGITQIAHLIEASIQQQIRVVADAAWQGTAQKGPYVFTVNPDYEGGIVQSTLLSQDTAWDTPEELINEPCNRGVTATMDYGALFRIVPPGATVSHTCSGGCQIKGIPSEDTPTDPKYVLPVTYSFTNKSQRWAFVYMFDTIQNQVILPGGDTASGRYCAPWMRTLRFRINDPTVAGLFGLESGEWMDVKVPKFEVGTKFSTDDTAYWDGSGYQMSVNARWPETYMWLSSLNWFRETYDTFEATKKVELPGDTASYSPKSLVPAPPSLTVQIDLISGLQTRYANNKPTSTVMIVPMPFAATDIIQYTNTTVDWSLQRRTDRISQFRVTLLDGEGNELNSSSTLPPYDLADYPYAALIPETPDWTMEIVFE